MFFFFSEPPKVWLSVACQVTQSGYANQRGMIEECSEPSIGGYEKQGELETTMMCGYDNDRDLKAIVTLTRLRQAQHLYLVPDQPS